MRDFKLFDLLKLFALFPLRRTRYTLHATRYTLILLAFLTFFTFLPFPSYLSGTVYAAVMGDYCVMPPYVKTDIQPNVLFLMDNSYAMKDAAYTLNYATTPPGAAVDADSDGYYEGYNNSKTFTGYFNNTLRYTYTSGKFVPSSTGIFSGNLMNWVTTSKYDLLEQILIGGLSESRQTNVNTLVGLTNTWQKEYGGCRFIVTNGALTITEETNGACPLLTGIYLAFAPLPYEKTLTKADGAGPESPGKSFEVSIAIGDKGSERAEKSTEELIKTLIDGAWTALAKIMDFIVSDAEAACRISTGGTDALGDGTIGGCYSDGIIMKDGSTACTAATYTFGPQASPHSSCTSNGVSPIVPGLSLNGTTGVISGTVTAGTTANNKYCFKITTTTPADSVDMFITVRAPSALSVQTGGALPNATESQAYSASLTATGGALACSSSYTWSLFSGSLPDGLSLSGAGEILGTPTAIAGNTVCPTSTTGGTVYTFTTKATDSVGTISPASSSITIRVCASGGASAPRSSNYNIKVCVGDYTNNCNAGTAPTKSGLVDKFWGKARFGLENFKDAGAGDIYPDIGTGTCIYVDSLSNFYTGIENTSPVGSATLKTPLVNGLSYRTAATDTATGAMTYYRNNGTPNCDPFRDAANACLKNFALVISSGEGADTGTNVLADNANCTATQGVNYNLSKNACYGYSNDLRSATLGFNEKSGKQFVNTYIVNTMGTATCITGPPAVSCSTILGEAATKGGGSYYNVTDATTLSTELEGALKDIIKRAAAGTAASVLASGEGSGANLIQAIFYPRKKFFNTALNAYEEISWTGRLTNLWYYVDPFFANSNIREDGTSDKILDLDTDIGSDKITQLYFDSTTETTKARRWNDTDGDGDADGAQISPDVEFESLGSLWEAGFELWKRNLSSSPRTIKTWLDKDSDGVIDSGEFIELSATSYAALIADDKTTLRTYLQAADDTEATKLINYIHGYDKLCSGTTTPCFQDSECTSPATCVSSGFRTRTVKVETHDTTARVWKLGDVLNSTPKISSWLPLNTYHKVYKDTTYGEEGKDPSLSDAVDTTHYITSLEYKKKNMVFAGANDGMLHAFKLGTLGLKWTGQTSTQQATLGKHCSNPSYKPCVSGGITGGCAAAGDTCDTETDLGKELWTFIPKNALPYLKYTADTGYCHIYSADLTPYVFDASIKVVAGASNGTNTNGQASTIYADCTNAKDTDPTFDYWKCIKNADSWRTILIGGMRFGGACRNNGAGCNSVNTKFGTCSNAPGTACDVTTDCATPTPAGTCLPNCVNTPVADKGYSSYFALDITDQNNPTLLWEYTSPENDLGFTTTGPALVRINARKGDSPTTSIADDYKTTNGRWFVVFGSGPTGPIEPSTQQFLGASDQRLRLFILDLKTGTRVRKITMDGTDGPDVNYAFAGSMLGATHDTDQDYQDDVIYIPYVKKEASTNAWTNGGVLRLLTKEDLNGTVLSGGATGTTALNPANWAVSTLMDGIGPVSSSTVRLQNQKTNKLWVYFGTGRYFYEIGANTDDPTNQRKLLGIPDPCFSGSFNTSCTTSVPATGAGSPAQVNLASVEGVADNTNGWYIDLDPAASPTTTFTNCNGAGTTTCPANQYGYCEGNPASIVCRDYKAERVVTDPLAASTGVVFFTTYKPYAEECSLGGKSFIWATKYDTGGAAGTLLKGKALVQVSTGSIEQMDMSSAFSEKGGRRTSAIEGVPPTAQGLSIVSTPPALKRVLHIRQR